MKLLKYVMTDDTGLAPNPYFGVCSLAVCTPNHTNRRLNPGDWLLGHTTKDTGRKLVYAMKVTKVLDMSKYHREFPTKRPKIRGQEHERCGDAIYYQKEGAWVREPSVFHNNVEAFRKDRGRRVYLSEGEENFWYFGANHTASFLAAFPSRFPAMVQETQGCLYVRDEKSIDGFVKWLRDNSPNSGKLGCPRDRIPPGAKKYLISIDPITHWTSYVDLPSSAGPSTGAIESPPFPKQQRGGCR